MTTDHQVHIVDNKDKFFEFGSDVKISAAILSELHVPLVVRQRNGVSSAIRPKYGAGYQPSIVRIQLEVLAKPEVFMYIDSQSMETLPEEYQILYQAIQSMKERGVQMGNMHYARICLTYSHEYLARHGGQVYLPIVDLLLSILPIDGTAPHPFSVSAMQQEQSNQLTTDYDGHVLYAVRLVDRYDQLGPRYMNIAGDVFRVTALPLDALTEQQTDGLYILGTQPMRGPKDTTNSARTTYIPIDKLLKDPTQYGLWSGFGEARHQGNKQLESTLNALETAQRDKDKKDRLIENLKKELEEAKQKQKQEGSLVLHKGLTELLKLATAMIGIVKLLK